MLSVGYLDPCCCQKKLQCGLTGGGEVLALVLAGVLFVSLSTRLLKKIIELTIVIYKILFKIISIVYLLSVSEGVT